jgi:hypothetical protein
MSDAVGRAHQARIHRDLRAYLDAGSSDARSAVDKLTASANRMDGFTTGYAAGYIKGRRDQFWNMVGLSVPFVPVAGVLLWKAWKVFGQ